MVQFLAGAALFGAVQGWLLRVTAPMPGIEDSGWFLNAPRGVESIAVVFAVAGLIVGLSRRNAVREAAITVIGALVAMTAVLFAIGPGTIFPIVMCIGAVIIGSATAAGTAIGMGLAHAMRCGETK
ncbi:MAG TPA: hypothetical protein VJP86_01835 [Vicinamibacterales bacterium]|jgi:hypothetical protein|nr:hypothetical protein [Vicinamibacterales bacterium]